MTSFKFNILFLFLFLAVLMYSCSDDTTNNGPPVDTSTFTYPFTNGSTWNYNRTFSSENIRPDSANQFFSNFTFHAHGDVTILYDTMINGIQTKCFHERYTEVQESDTLVFHSRSYYGNYDTAFVRFARRSSTGSFGLPDSPKQIVCFEKFGMRFNSPQEIFRFIETGSTSAGNDSLYIDTPPSRILKYPISIGTEWVANYYEGTPVSTKKYLSFNVEYVGNTPVSCIKIHREFLLPLNDIIAYEYYSKYGIVKKDYLIKDILITTQLGVPVGLYDARDKVEITSYNIINP